MPGTRRRWPPRCHSLRKNTLGAGRGVTRFAAGRWDLHSLGNAVLARRSESSGLAAHGGPGDEIVGCSVGSKPRDDGPIAPADGLTHGASSDLDATVGI